MTDSDYPYTPEVRTQMRKHVALPIRDVRINTMGDEFVTVDVEVIMTREQVKGLFNEPPSASV